MIKHLSLLKTQNLDGYQCGIASMVYKFFDKKTSGSGIKNVNISNKRPLDLAVQELAEELHISIIRKLIKEKYNLLILKIFGVQI